MQTSGAFRSEDLSPALFTEKFCRMTTPGLLAFALAQPWPGTLTATFTYKKSVHIRDNFLLQKIKKVMQTNLSLPKARSHFGSSFSFIWE